MPSRSGSSAGRLGLDEEDDVVEHRHQLARHVVEGVLDDRVELLVGQRLHVTTLSPPPVTSNPVARRVQSRGARSQARPGPCSGAPRQRAVTVPSAQRSSSECGVSTATTVASNTPGATQPPLATQGEPPASGH